MFDIAPNIDSYIFVFCEILNLKNYQLSTLQSCYFAPLGTSLAVRNRKHFENQLARIVLMTHWEL